MSNTNLITLSRWLLSVGDFPLETRIELVNLFEGIQLACKITSNAIRRAGFEELFGLSGKVNVHDEDVKKLDVVANDAWITSLKTSKEVCVMVSEEEPEILFVEESQAGRYVVTFDPLDGSSNLDCNINVGSIFAVWKKKSEGKAGKPEDVLQRTGREIMGAGYALYGTSTMLVLSIGTGVCGFTLDQSVGEFVLTHDDIKIGKKGNIYSVNEGNSKFWDKPTRDYVESIKTAKSPYSLRYIGSMVGDVHRTLLYGGIFMYPADSKSPNGKLRYLYEVAPLSWLMELAGGKSSTGKQQCLDLVSTNIHMRVPVFMGSYDDVSTLEKFYSINSA